MSNALVSGHVLAVLRVEDAQTQEDLVREFSPRLVGLARLRGFSVADAEEIAQDTLSAALAQLRQGRFEGRSQLSSWVHAIFKRRAADRHRSNVRRHPESVSLEVLADSGRELPDGLTREEEATALRVQGALAQLNREHRVVLLLNLQEGHSAKDLARILRRHHKTVEAMVTTAKKAFRQAYLDQLGPGPKIRRGCSD